jgi:hypothetical protein
MPVVSDTAFSAIPSSAEEPTLWTIEMPPSQLRLSPNEREEVSLQELEWVRSTLVDGEVLARDPVFNRAFVTFDSVRWSHSLQSALIMSWAAVETLFRQGRNQVTKTLGSSMATFLNPPGPARDAAYAQIVRLYETRGSAAHDSQLPEEEQLLQTFALARLSLIKCLDLRQLPSRDDLLTKWKARA